MIQLSPRGALLYQLLTLCAALLPLYTLAALLGASALVPGTPLGGGISAASWAALADALFTFLLLSAYIAAGVQLAGAGLSRQRAQQWRGLWLAALAAGGGALLFGQPLALDTLIGGALLLITLSSFSARGASSYLRLWQAGMLLCAISLPLAHFVKPAWADAAAAFRIAVAYALPALSLYFWLLGRCSSVERAWREAGLRILALLLTLAGALISLGRLGLPPALAAGAAPLIALAYMILASHGYRALSSRNENATLAPQWLALATLLWLVSGLFAALSIQPGINAAMRGSDIAAAQRWLMQWALLAVALAWVNEGTSALRGDNRRVTGFAPFWLMAFGAALTAAALLCRGAAYIALRDIAARSPTLAELLPFTFVLLLCLAAVALGGLSYALGYWRRRARPRIIDD